MSSWIADFIAHHGVAGIAALTLIETVFPPLPSEVVMPLAGIAAARGEVPVAAAVAAGIAGSMGGNIVFYAAARRLGEVRFDKWLDRHGRWLTLDRRTMARARRWFARYGGWAVGIGRCVPGIRSIVSVPAALTGMGWAPFLLWSTVGTTIWTTALTLAGYRLGEAGIPAVERWLGPASNIIVGIAVAVYLGRLLTWRRG